MKTAEEFNKIQKSILNDFDVMFTNSIIKITSVDIDDKILAFDTKLKSDDYVDSAVVNVSDKFITDVRGVLYEYTDGKISFNNTRTTFWIMLEDLV